MKKNIVFIVDIDLSGEGRWASSRRTPYEYSIKSWKHWCNKNNCECYWYEEGEMELKPKYQKIAYSNLVPLLIGSIQELKKQLDNI